MSITTIQEDAKTYGIIRYFYSDRCENTESMKEFNQWKITADELVTFDCDMMEMEEIETPDIAAANKNSQILAVIIRPAIEVDYFLENTEYEFCGYDLVDMVGCVSALTDSNARFENAIDYTTLNQYGLISSYRKAVTAQLDLNEKYPDDSHSYCEIIEIWRKLLD